MDPADELRIESRVSSAGLAVILLQRHPENRHKWAPVANWGRCLEAWERANSLVVLELKALREECWKLSEFISFAPQLTMWVSPKLCALLKILHRAHPELQAALMDLTMYRPTFIAY